MAARTETTASTGEEAADATDLYTQRESSDKVVVEGVLSALAMALEERKDAGVIYKSALVVGDLASSIDEDEKIQFFELMVPHIESSFTPGCDTRLARILMYALYRLARDDPIARQRLRDIPTFMQKMDALERVVNPTFSFERFVKDMRSLTPSGKMTKATRA